jgi:hypothetical protein
MQIHFSFRMSMSKCQLRMAVIAAIYAAVVAVFTFHPTSAAAKQTDQISSEYACAMIRTNCFLTMMFSISTAVVRMLPLDDDIVTYFFASCLSAYVLIQAWVIEANVTNSCVSAYLVVAPEVFGWFTAQIGCNSVAFGITSTLLMEECFLFQHTLQVANGSRIRGNVLL